MWALILGKKNDEWIIWEWEHQIYLTINLAKNYDSWDYVHITMFTTSSNNYSTQMDNRIVIN